MIHLPRTQHPPITIRQAECKRLGHLADASVETFPAAAEFLAREIERATVVSDTAPLVGIVGMESEVTFRDDATGSQKRVRLVYPTAAAIDAGRVSVLPP